MLGYGLGRDVLLTGQSKDGTARIGGLHWSVHRDDDLVHEVGAIQLDMLFFSKDDRPLWYGLEVVATISLL